MNEHLLDPKTKEILASVYPDLSARIKRAYEEMKRVHGKSMKATMGIRTIQQQELLYAKGRTSPGPRVTNSRPGDSLHHYGLAIDSAFCGDDPYLVKLANSGDTTALRKINSAKANLYWREFGRICRSHGLRWGGDWNSNGIEDKNDFDKPHAEITYELSLAQIKMYYSMGGMLGVWRICDQKRGLPPTPGPMAKVEVLGLKANSNQKK